MSIARDLALAVLLTALLFAGLLRSAESLGAGMPVAVRADFPSECALVPPPELRPEGRV